MKKWYEIKNQSDYSEIVIFDEIGMWGVDASMFKKDLDGIKDSKSIKVLLNSPGGSVFDGVAIYNMLKEYKSKLEIEVVGLAASIASIIAMAGSKITMRQGTFMMIHKPWTVAMGDASEFVKTATLLDQIEDQMVGIYKSKTGIEEEEIKSMLKEETWMTPSQAKELGFIDEIDEAPKMAAKFNKDLKALGFNKVPAEVAQDLKQQFPATITVNGSDIRAILELNNDRDVRSRGDKNQDEPSSKGDIHEIKEKGDESLRDTSTYEKRLKILQHTIN